MIIEPIYHKLFEVRDVLPTLQVEKLLSLDWLNLPCEDPPQQKHMIRKKIQDKNVELLSQTNSLLEECCKQIGEELNFQFDYTFTLWWLDLPGMTSGVHIDSTNTLSMQLYWVAPDTNYGTTFYNKRTLKPQPADIIKEFKFIPNTGYINDLRGSISDKIYHGMLNPVPDNSFRISSYTQLVKYEC